MNDTDRISIGVIVYPGFKSIEAIGPMTVFMCANRAMESRGLELRYDVTIHSEEDGYVSSDTMMGLHTSVLPKALPDTCLVVGSPVIVKALEENQPIISWLRRYAADIRRCAGLCTGAFFLGEAGLLNDRRATTHWRYADTMKNRFPQIEIVPDSIFLQQDNLWTSAGVSAAIDLCLAYVESDFGHEVALEVARELVIYLRRPGGQSQFSGELAVNISSSKVISETQAWVLSNLKNKLSMEALAERCSMSVRSFRRQFHKETGQCPTEYIEKARLDRARVVLRDSALPIKSIAYQCGFPSDDQMRAAFRKHLAITPKEYRERFVRSVQSA
ncbi:GlxA family transcriptional regulator [Pseudomonas syringae]|uniref:Transcriptional regulator GlxA family n=1 Tax=Pseudomonas syringae pv. actinidiae TaxID=103796 RepID=A0A2V0QQN3_PSESF|nr:GlxA family transcriptional regulator [Pseudomonas syringae]BBI43244.1 HTH-type transcriptional regulator CdhR [Pseudomonas syringae pv. actinidiae]GBH11552.1 Transcriptional regulator GlxA family [Pseudomonas syringae pv. actinidiae]